MMAIFQDQAVLSFPLSTESELDFFPLGWSFGAGFRI